MNGAHTMVRPIARLVHLWWCTVPPHTLDARVTLWACGASRTPAVHAHRWGATLSFAPPTPRALRVCWKRSGFVLRGEPAVFLTTCARMVTDLVQQRALWGRGRATHALRPCVQFLVPRIPPLRHWAHRNRLGRSVPSQSPEQRAAGMKTILRAQHVSCVLVHAPDARTILWARRRATHAHRPRCGDRLARSCPRLSPLFFFFCSSPV